MSRQRDQLWHNLAMNFNNYHDFPVILRTLRYRFMKIMGKYTINPENKY